MSSVDKKPKFEPDPPPDVTGLDELEALRAYTRWNQTQFDRAADWWPRENESRLNRLEQFVPLVGTWPIVDYSYVSVTLSEMIGCDPLSYTQTDTYDTTSDNSVGFQQLAISPDGQYLYAANSGAGGLGRGIAQYTMSTPYDMTTLSYTNFKALPAIFLIGIEVKTDGTEMYVADGNSPYNLLSYAFSTAWDITTLSTTASKTKALSFQTSGLCISPDGLYAYTGTNVIDDHKIVQYTMSSAWDIDTLSYTTAIDTQALPGWPLGTNWRCICCDVSTTGMTLLTNGKTGGIAVFKMTTPWSLATLQYIREPAAIGGGFTEGIALTDDCQKVYMSTPSLDEFKEFDVG